MKATALILSCVFMFCASYGAAPLTEQEGAACEASHIEIRCPNMMYTMELKFCTICGEEMSYTYHDFGDCDNYTTQP